MANRHKDALACNDDCIVEPIAICYAIIRAVKEIARERGNRLNDPAVVILAAQLAYVTGVRTYSVNEFAKLFDTCRAEISKEE